MFENEYLKIKHMVICVYKRRVIGRVFMNMCVPVLEVRVPGHVGGELLHEGQQHVLLEARGRREHARGVGRAARRHHQRQVRGRQRQLERAVHVAAHQQRLDLAHLHLVEHNGVIHK